MNKKILLLVSLLTIFSPAMNRRKITKKKAMNKRIIQRAPEYKVTQCDVMQNCYAILLRKTKEKNDIYYFHESKFRNHNLKSSDELVDNNKTVINGNTHSLTITEEPSQEPGEILTTYNFKKNTE